MATGPGVAGVPKCSDANTYTGSSAVALGLKCTIVNLMTVATPQQVMLKVRFLEVDRNAGRQLGVNLTGSNLWAGRHDW